jgi:tetratricopeptide (TPR) repeat protein
MTTSGVDNTQLQAQPIVCNDNRPSACLSHLRQLSLAGFMALSLSLAFVSCASATKLNAKPLPHAGASDGASGTSGDVNEYGRPVKDFAHGQESTLPPSQWKERKLDYRDAAAKEKEEAAAKAKAQADAVKKAQDDRINAIKTYQQISIDANNKAIALGKQGKLPEAIAEHELSLKYDPGNKQFKINLSAAQTLYGQRLLAQKDYAGSSNMFRKALVAMPDNGQAGKYLAESIKRMGLDPALADNRLGIGDQLAAAGDIAGANVEYQQAMTLDPSDRTYTKMGDMAMRYGQAANAVNWYRQAIVKNPDYGPAHRQLGNLMMAMKDMTGAAAELRKAVIIDPKDTAAGQGLIEIWRRQVALNPTLAENHIGLGTAMQLTGDIGTAENEYNLAEKLDPRNASIPAARASLQRAVKHVAAEKHKAAAETFYNQGLARDALAEIGQAVMIEPHNDKYQFLLGQCLENSGDREGARQAFHTCVLIDPKNTEAAQHLRDIENSGGASSQRPPQQMGLSRPDSGGSQVGQQYGGMSPGATAGSAVPYRQAGQQVPSQGGAASGRDKNMFEAPQSAGAGTPYQVNGGGRQAPPAQYAAQQGQRQVNAGQSSSGQSQAAPPRTAASAAAPIDPQTQAILTSADNMEKQHDFQGAANLLQQSLGNNLQNPQIHHQLAVNLLNLGQLEEAVSEFRIASALSPGNKMFMDDYARALKIHKKAMQADDGQTSNSGQATSGVGDLK